MDLRFNEEYVPKPTNYKQTEKVKVEKKKDNKKEKKRDPTNSTCSDDSGLDETYQNLVKKSENKRGKISQDDFNLISVIGTGSYGKVFLVRNKSN
jgi:hypothetical protein